jgi:hypothetical protein
MDTRAPSLLTKTYYNISLPLPAFFNLNTATPLPLISQNPNRSLLDTSGYVPTIYSTPAHINKPFYSGANKQGCLMLIDIR